jgi:hypothetical protein
MIVHLAHAVGEVAERSDAGEGLSARPHPALRADLSHCVGEVYGWRDATNVSASMHPLARSECINTQGIFVARCEDFRG